MKRPGKSYFRKLPQFRYDTVCYWPAILTRLVVGVEKDLKEEYKNKNFAKVVYNIIFGSM